MESTEKKDLKILIVDDDKVHLRLLRGILEKKLDISVIECDDGLAALQLIEIHNPFMILLDIMLPNMNGLEILQEIRNNPMTKNIPVLVCSAFGEKSKIIELFNRGIIDFLEKPINPTILLTKIRNYIQTQEK